VTESTRMKFLPFVTMCCRV